MRRLLGMWLALSPTLSIAQTGRPLWSSLETSAFDAVNRQNLNVNFSIPLVSTPSRAGSFNYALVYDSLIWTKNGSVWSPVKDGSGNPIWGWRDNQPLGATTFSNGNIFCDTQPPTSSPHFFNYKYTDGNGTVHSFPLNFYWVPTACQFPTGPRTAGAVDGSGYFIDASSPAGPIVYSPSGDKIIGTRTDSNGNFISGIVVNGSETDFKDTNGRVTVKKIKNSNTQRQYQILDQTGSYANVIASATYTSKNVKTHFACAGVSEYTATGIYLITQLALPNGKFYSFTYEATPGFSGYVTGRIQRVTLPTGGYFEYDYPTTGNNGINCIDGRVTSLTRVINDGNSNTWTFSSVSGITTEQYPALPYDGGVANTSVFTFSGTKLTQQTLRQGSSTLLRTINRTYATNGTPSVTTTILEDGQTQTKVETDYDSNANLLETREYDRGTGAPGALVRRTTNTYLTGSAYTTANILNRITRVVVKDGGGNIKARTDINYDEYGTHPLTCVTGALQHNDSGYGCSFATRGNPTSSVRYSDAATPSGGTTTNFFYDSLGNIVKTDVNGVVQQQRTLSSATQWAFPDSITLGPGSGPQLTNSATYNANTGLSATATDANSQVTHFTYDSLRRLTDIQRPDNAHVTYSYDDPNNKVTVTNPVQGTDVVRQVSYLDSLGRVKKIAIADVSNTTYSIVETQFDSLGRAYKTSNPHNSTAQYWTEADADALGRVTKQILPDGNQTTFAYSGNSTTITDPAGHKIQRLVDALGRLGTVNEPDVNNQNQLTVATTYTYDALDDITSVSQGAQTRSSSYDSLGRAQSVTFPETGQVQYQYNAFDQVAQRTDARNVITTYSYDTLNRLYQVSYNVGATGVPATPTVTYTFGANAAQYNNGRLITLATASVESDSFTYDQLGRVTNVSKNITGAQTYNLGYGYNLAGEVATLTYPSGRVVTQSYDVIGRLSQVSDATPRTYVNQFSFNPAQQALGYTLGNGVQGTFTFADSRLQLGSLTYKKGATTLFSLGYGYTQPNSGNNGQVTSITDNLASTNSLSLTYDALGRLTRGATSSLTAPNTWDISWVYDRYGNRAQQTETGGTLAVTNQSLTLNNNNQLTGGFFYDASGNMTDDGVTHNYVYDAEGRFAKLGTTVANTYDGQSLRVEKVTGGSTTAYVFSGMQVIAEYSPTASTAAPSKEYLYSGGQLLATLDASHNPTYRTPDLLSARLFTDASGNSVGTQGHLPFGESWYSTGTVDKWKFTSYERDTDTNLDYARMRFNSGRLARFMSPDPYSGSIDISNPQSWNRYAYVTNDPLNLMDALGLCGQTFDPSTNTVNWDFTDCGDDISAPILIVHPSASAMPFLSTGQWFHAVRLATLEVAANNGTCPAVPQAPPGAKINSNIKISRWMKVVTYTDPLVSLYAFDQMVGNKKPWDYKQQGWTLTDTGQLSPSSFQEFGNFNFGATGAAWGIPLNVLQRGAGYAQGKAGTSTPEWGHWYQGPPYGDDPADQAQIAAGYQYYQNGCYKKN